MEKIIKSKDKKVVIRDLAGHYMNTLEHNFLTVKTWFRENSPYPSYPQHAAKFTLEILPIDMPVPAFRKPAENTDAISFKDYALKYAPDPIEKQQALTVEEKPAPEITSVKKDIPKKTTKKTTKK